MKVTLRGKSREVSASFEVFYYKGCFSITMDESPLGALGIGVRAGLLPIRTTTEVPYDGRDCSGCCLVLDGQVWTFDEIWLQQLELLDGVLHAEVSGTVANDEGGSDEDAVAREQITVSIHQPVRVRGKPGD